jgi:hypothetical protein
MPWVVVDRYGRRFMNEFPPAPQDTSARPLAAFDPEVPCYPRIPSYLILDESGIQKRPLALPLGFPEHFPEGRRYRWSSDNSSEIEKGWILKGQSIQDLAQQIKKTPANQQSMDDQVLADTIGHWNRAVERGSDPDYCRSPETMHMISQPPFYALETWPIITNTQGGPEHNERRQLIDLWGSPIPRLYSAGELGSFFGHLYELSGNIGECISSGRIAGQAAAEENPI